MSRTISWLIVCGMFSACSLMSNPERLEVKDPSALRADPTLGSAVSVTHAFRLNQHADFGAPTVRWDTEICSPLFQSKCWRTTRYFLSMQIFYERGLMFEFAREWTQDSDTATISGFEPNTEVGDTFRVLIEKWFKAVKVVAVSGPF